ncbi:protein root hair defective 3, partial [Tanacetum coccineum]
MYHIVPCGEFNGVHIALVARSVVLSVSSPNDPKSRVFPSNVIQSPLDRLALTLQEDVQKVAMLWESAQQIWKVIKENKDLDLPSHKVMVENIRCEEIANKEYSSFTSNDAHILLVLLTYQSMLKHMISGTSENFKNAFIDALNEGKGFALAARDCTEKF